MNFEDLQFKAEDFEPNDYYAQNGFLEAFVDLANRILAEKLSQAPEVLGGQGTLEMYMSWIGPLDEYAKPVHCTHKARLVCIEKL